MTKCKLCKTVFNQKHFGNVFCSSNCRVKHGQITRAKTGEEIKCVTCVTRFFRKSAKDVYCAFCKAKLKGKEERAGTTISKVNLRIRDNTDKENKMIEEFLKNKDKK